MVGSSDVIAVGDDPTAGGSPRSGGDLSSVEKALALIEVFEEPGIMLRLSEIARRSGVRKSTAFRLIGILVDAGFVERVGDHYRLGVRLFELGTRTSYFRPRSICDAATPYMCDLHAATSLTVHLAILEGNDVLYLKKVGGSVRAPSRVGGRIPAATTALGKAMLAFSSPEVVVDALSSLEASTRYTIAQAQVFADEFSTIRRDGVAYDREESRLGLECVAAPIVKDGCPVAAISLSSATQGFDSRTVAERVRYAAAQIEKRLRSR